LCETPSPAEDALDGVGQAIDFTSGVLEGQRRSDGGFQPQAAQGRLGAMVAGADGDAGAQAIEAATLSR
jgi:hypothetical protein